MTGTRHQVNDLLQEGWEVYTVDEVRVEHEAETRRMWLPKGKRTKLYVDRKKASRSFFGALSLTTKKMRIYPIEGNQNAEQITLMMDRLARETDEGKKIAVVLDNARFHHARALTDLYAPGQALERITPIYLPPYAPDLGSHGTRVERRQEQHRQPPTRHPGENLHGLHHLHHQPHLRLRLRAPPNHTTPHRLCLIPAIDRKLPDHHDVPLPESVSIRLLRLAGPGAIKNRATQERAQRLDRVGLQQLPRHLRVPKGPRRPGPQRR